MQSQDIAPRASGGLDNFPRQTNKTHDRAAKVLARTWRTRFQFQKTVDLAKKMIEDNNMISDYVKSISFETLVVHLRDKKVITASKNLVQRLHYLCAKRHGTLQGFRGGDVNVRVVLAAYMIAYRPTHVFEQMGELERSLQASSKIMLDNLEDITKTLMRSVGKRFAEVPAAMTRNFQQVMFDYIKTFKAWKVPDEAKLSCRIKHALIALYQAQQHLPPDEPKDSKLSKEFFQQIERLRAKLVQISGQAALDAFDTERTARCGTPFSAGGGNGGGSAGGRSIIPGRMKNEQMAHELLLDPSFQLSETGFMGNDNAAFDRMRESFHRAFWDSLVDDIRLSPPCYVRVYRVLKEIRDGVKDLSGRGDEALDVDHIKTMVEQDAFGWAEAKTLIVGASNLIKQIQAPRREEETNALFTTVMAAMDAADNKDSMAVSFTKSLEFLLDRVNAMRIDAANARLRLIAPVIRDHGVDYESGKFQDKLKNGEVTLKNTTTWITATLKSAMDIASQVQDSVSGSVLQTHTLATTLLVDGSIFPEVDDITEESVPETLAFDVSRIRAMRQDFDDIIKASIILVVTSNNDAKELPKVMECFSGLDDFEPLDPKTVATTQELENCFATSIDPSNQIFQLLRKRLSKHIRANLYTSDPAPIKISPHPLPPTIAKRANRLVKTLGAVSNLNRQAHQKLYEKIVPEIARAVCTEGV